MEPASCIIETPAPSICENEAYVPQKEFSINYKDDIIKIFIGKTSKNIIIRSSYYEIRLTPEELSKITKMAVKTVDDAFNFIENIFENKKYTISNITPKELNLVINIFDIITGNKKDIPLILNENIKDNSKFLIKELFEKNKELKKEIIQLKEENLNLKKEIEDNNKEISNMKENQNMIKDQIAQFESKIYWLNFNFNKFNTFNQFGGPNQNYNNNFNNFGQFNQMNPNQNNYNVNLDDYIYPVKKEEGEEIEIKSVSIFYNNDRVVLPCTSETTISKLIFFFKMKLRIEDDFILVFNGVKIPNELTLQEANIKNESKLYLYKLNEAKNFTTLESKNKANEENKDNKKITNYEIPKNNNTFQSINIIFKSSNFLLKVLTPIDVKIKNLLSKFFTLTTKYKKDDTKFLYNGKPINMDERLTISQMGLKDGVIINVESYDEVFGA